MEVHVGTRQCTDTRYKIQESLFNVGYMIILVTLAHLSYFPTKRE